jgi:hypothetical protein
MEFNVLFLCTKSIRSASRPVNACHDLQRRSGTSCFNARSFSITGSETRRVPVTG